MKLLFTELAIYPTNARGFHLAHLITEVVNKTPNLNKQDIFILGDFNINYADNRNKGRKHLKDFEFW